MNPDSPAPVLPRGVANAYAFQIFNSSSWSLILGTPMLLFLKSQDASAVMLGLAVAMLPLFSALQIPAANFVERIGYKNFVVRGWASRSIFILGIAFAALLPAAILSPRQRIVLSLLMLSFFAAARGVSICGYMPWLTLLIPDRLRGTFMSRDAMCTHLALTGTMMLASSSVNAFPSRHTFGALFVFSYLCALGAVYFLRRIPDVQHPLPLENRTRPPWKEMILYPPFLKYVSFSVCLGVFSTAGAVVWIPFMKDGLHSSSGLILGLSAYSSMICALTSLAAGPVIDRFGSRPLMGSGSGLVLISQTGWMALSAGALPNQIGVLLTLVTLSATGSVSIGVAGVRLLMGIIPAMGRSHFFAISSVSTSLTLGVMPIVWGFGLDKLLLHMKAGIALRPNWTWTPYSLLYAVLLAGTLAAQILRHRIDEPRAMSTEEFLRIVLIQSPIRIVSRVMSPLRRFQFPGG